MSRRRSVSITRWCFALLVACTSVSPAYAVIYGADDRIEVFNMTSPAPLLVAQSTAVILLPGLVVAAPGGGFDIDAFAYGTYGEYFDLCQGERFWDEPSPGFCSGWLVGQDLMVTAGHCVSSSSDCAGATFVFDFAMIDQVTPRTHVENDDVYHCVEIIAAENTPTRDYAVLRLDRPVVDRDPIPVRRTGSVESDPDVAGLFSAGHPAGIPMKIAGGPTPIGTTGLSGATVKDSFPEYFEANLDVYGGNSGSPVVSGGSQGAAVISVDAQGQLLFAEGVLVRGNEDFVEQGSCFVSNECADDMGCTGGDGDGWEEVTRSTVYEGFVPRSGACCTPFECAEVAVGECAGEYQGDGTSCGDADCTGPLFLTLCHVPPGNPANAHTITVGFAAAQAHLDHGDTLGACEIFTPGVTFPIGGESGFVTNPQQFQRSREAEPSPETSHGRAWGILGTKPKVADSRAHEAR